MVPNDLIDGLDNTLFHLLQLAHKPFFQSRTSARRHGKPAISPLGHERLLLSLNVNFTT